MEASKMREIIFIRTSERKEMNSHELQKILGFLSFNKIIIKSQN